jgi:orotidine-5'-phosphate decarboxylase
MARYGEQEQPEGSNVPLAEQDDPRRAPHQGQGPLREQSALRRPSLLRRPESLRALPSLARFLRQAGPGDARTGQRAAGEAGSQDAAVGTARTWEGAQAARGAARGPAGTAVPSAPASSARDSPEASAAELRELTELSDLLTELAGLVHDLSGLIVGLMTAAAGNGDGQARTFTMPPALAELARAHQDLKAEQQTLNARFEAARSQQERTGLRGSLAALTERATRAVAAAAAAVTPQEIPPSDTPVTGQGSLPSGTPVAETAPDREAQSAPRQGLQGDAPQGDASYRAPDTMAVFAIGRPIREETGVQRLAPVAVALDAPDIEVAAHWATLVTPHVSTVKIGLELYLRYGPAVVATVRGGSGVRVFLDLKLHDIPNTVAGAARAVAKLRPEILTVHAAGGADMIKAAVEAAPDTLVAGVTLLTSISDKDLAELGMDGSASDAVRRMAALAVRAGARGLVCSPQEVAAVRTEVGPGILLITPGIRLAGAPGDDQARVATPEEALKAGADLLVIGRPITKSPDPGAAAAGIAASLRRALPAG